MTDIILKNYEFERCILDNVNLFDEILAECGEPPLFENKNFTPFLSFPISSRCLAVELSTSNPNNLLVIIWFEGEDLKIEFDQINEAFEWSKKQIEENKKAVVEIIRNLLTGYILIEKRGMSRFVQVFDANGLFVNSLSVNSIFHMLTGIYLFHSKNNRRLFLPLFSKEE